MIRHRALWVWSVLVLVACALGFVLNQYQLFQVTQVLVWAIVILGTNVLTGYAGQLSIAHNAFVAVGAYTAAVLTVDHGWHYLATLPVAAVLGLALGAAFGVPALRVKGLYLATATLALAVAVIPVLKRADFITHGASGIVAQRLTAPEWTGLKHYQWRFAVTAAVALLVFILVRNLLDSHVGRALKSIKDHPIASTTFGVSAVRYKVLAFALSAALGSIGGVLLCLNVGVVTPDTFSVHFSILVLAACVIGGSASVVGALVGGLVLQYVPAYASEVNPALSGLIFGTIIIVFMSTMPGGVIAGLRILWRRLASFRTHAQSSDPSPRMAPAAEDPVLFERRH